MKPYVVLARRYRPKSFEEVLGQEPIARTLTHAIEAGRVAHAYIFAGPRGIGKTSMARIFASALCCSSGDDATPDPCGECDICRSVATGDDLDVIEIDGASNRGIDQIRELRQNAMLYPARARLKIYIIDEVHMLSTDAFNALLKTLEEPPPHVKFFFATTEPEKVLTTILSRCQRFDFRRIPTRTIAAHLGRICADEGVEAEPDALFEVAHASNGGMRDAQSLLDQLITLGGGTVRSTDLTALLGTVSSRHMEELLTAVGDGSDAAAIAIYEELYDQGVDPSEFLKQALVVLRDLLVLEICGADTDLVDLTPEAQAALAGIAKKWGRPRILYGLGLLSETLVTVKAVGEGRALVTLAIVKLARSQSLRSLDDIVADLRELEKRVGTGGGGAVAGGAESASEAASEAAVSPARSRPKRKTEELFESAAPEGALSGEESGHLDIARVLLLWPRVLERVGERSSAVGSFLMSGRVFSLSDRGVVVAFPPSARFQRDQLADPDRVRIVEEEIAEVLGRRLRFATEVAEEVYEEGTVDGGAPVTEGPTPVTREEMDKVGRQPIVSALKELFRARLVNIERT